MKTVAISYIITATLLHDIGKVCHYHDSLSDLKEKVRRQYRRYWHAPAGALLLDELGLPKEIIYLVQAHHLDKAPETLRSIPNDFIQNNRTIIDVITRADRADAQIRGEQGPPERSILKLPESITGKEEIIESLHGGDPLEIIRLKLKDVWNYPESLISILKESLALMRADKNVPGASLYMHSIIPAALALCYYLREEPRLLIINLDIVKRVRFATIESVEYLGGLQLYAYLGLLGAIAKSLNEYLKYVFFSPSLHILAESPTYMVALIPEGAIGVCCQKLQLLSNDLGLSIRLEVRDLNASLLCCYNFEPMAPIKPLVNAVICEYCKSPISAEETIELYGKKLCIICAHVTLAYKYLEKGETIFSIIDGLIPYGLIFPNLGVTAVPKYEHQKNVLIRRLLNPTSYRSVLKNPIPPVDIHIGQFNKEFKVWLLINTQYQLENILRSGREYMLHRFATACLFFPRLLRDEIARETSNYVILKWDPTGIMAQLQDETTAFKIAYRHLIKHGFSSIMDRVGQPGITYIKLTRKINGYHRSCTLPFIAISHEDTLITNEDVKLIKKWIYCISEQLGIDYQMAWRLAFKIACDFKEMVMKMEEPIDEIWLKSEILVKLGPILGNLNIGLPGFLEDPISTRTRIKKAIVDSIWPHLPKILSVVRKLHRYGVYPRA